MKKGKQEGYKFSDKKHPGKAIASVALGAVSFLALPVLFIKSGLSGGELGLYCGIIGLLMLFCSIAGLILAGLSFRKTDIHYTYPFLGVAVNSILVIGYLIIYISGIMAA